MRNSRHFERLRVLLLAVVCLMLAIESAVAQKDAPAKSADQAPRRERAKEQSPGHFVAFRLNHLTAHTAYETLENILERDAKMSVDQENNSLLVFGSEDVLKRVKEILKVLDVPSRNVKKANSNEELIRVFDVRDIQNTRGGMIEQSLRLILPNDDFALDMERGLMIARLTSEQAGHVESIVRVISDADKQQQTAPVTTKLRVVWLVGGLPEEVASETADAARLLPDVSLELANLGEKELRVAGQMLLNLTGEASRQFRAQGSVTLDSPATLSIDGHVHNKQRELVDLQIRIKASRDVPVANSGGRTTSELLSEIQTQISAPKGHAVVLGVTPFKSLTSVFVVELLP